MNHSGSGAGTSPVSVEVDSTVAVVIPKGSLTDRSGTTHATPGTSTQVMAQNTSRQFLIFQNVDDTAMWLNIDAAANAGGGSFYIGPRGSFPPPGAPFVPTGAVNVLCAATAKAYTAKEG